ncbi:MAG: hypoxanthine phosphoribosyltransferase [Eubacteriales bacterium]|nr:hypoxanthine phosphoribosyltransferase [Eubacteriales bacterium]MDD3199024.1 hypoxanthine phosphoribosyltransferase [Eubacteriales bacterium]MDD4121766.1 hypoxanthine phosphoribosyltransferase [Eubacteriales bacterium]MDD4629490.1 hypoxanthine phosphoribosyltransferase [Eubacteriales bacterium]
MQNNTIFGKVMISEEQLAQRIKELGKQISEDYRGEEVLMIGILKGAVLFLSDLIREITVDTKIDFMAVTSYGASTKSSGVVRILKDLDSGIEDLNVVIVEDIIDSGVTLHYLRDYLMGRKPKSLKICTLLDKPERREADILPDYVGFEVENKFIVGYGLDCDQKYRNLPYITCLEEA